MPSFQADVVAASFTDQNGDKSVLIPNLTAKTILNSENHHGPQESVTLSASRKESLRIETQTIVTVAMAGKGYQTQAILTSPAGKAVETEEFLNTDSLTQDQAIPATLTVHTRPKAWELLFLKPTSPSGTSTPCRSRRRSAFDLRNRGRAPLNSYSLNQMEFSGFDQKALDGM